MASVNVLLFGETGVGKSSVINLVAGRRVAGVSPDVHLCTLIPKPYRFPIDGRVFNILDTPGLEVPETGTGSMTTTEGILELIQQLAELGGIDLLLLCMRGGHITAATQSNYRLFYEGLCQSQVPIALVITHLEREADMDAWWTRNAQGLEKCGIKASGHACVTGLPKHSKYQESQANITRMLCGYEDQGRFSKPADLWSTESLRFSGLSVPHWKRKELLQVLMKRYKFDSKIAEELAGTLVRDNEPPKTFKKTDVNQAFHPQGRLRLRSNSQSQPKRNAASEGLPGMAEGRRERQVVAKPVQWVRSLFPLR